MKNEYNIVNNMCSNLFSVYPVFLYKESIIYTGSVCLMACIICSLIAYICHKKNGKKESFDKNKSNENPLELQNTDENEYAEIEDTVLYNIKTATKGGQIKDKESYNDTIQGNNYDVMIGYHNQYQPIISSEVDVHHYNSIINDGGNAIPSDDKQRNFGKLNPYQQLAPDAQEKKHVYNELVKQNIRAKDGEEEID